MTSQLGRKDTERVFRMAASNLDECQRYLAQLSEANVVPEPTIKSLAREVTLIHDAIKLEQRYWELNEARKWNEDWEL